VIVLLLILVEILIKKFHNVKDKGLDRGAAPLDQILLLKVRGSDEHVPLLNSLMKR
jgi:hypothetical protein